MRRWSVATLGGCALRQLQQPIVGGRPRAEIARYMQVGYGHGVTIMNIVLTTTILEARRTVCVLTCCIISTQWFRRHLDNDMQLFTRRHEACLDTVRLACRCVRRFRDEVWARLRLVGAWAICAGASNARPHSLGCTARRPANTFSVPGSKVPTVALCVCGMCVCIELSTLGISSHP